MTVSEMLPSIGAPRLGKGRLSSETLDELDPGIRAAVELLDQAGIETFESCQGGQNHAYPEPTVAFAGSRCEGWRALAAVLAYGADRGLGRLRCLRREWSIRDGEPTDLHWELVWFGDMRGDGLSHWDRPPTPRHPWLNLDGSERTLP
jgi:hypothetical protein